MNIKLDCSLSQRLKQVIAAQQPVIGHSLSDLTIWIAHSGGIDSTVLLHALAALRTGGLYINLKVLHVNHSLHPQAPQWATHCQRICQSWQIPCTILTVDGRAKPGQSPEEAARKARYQVLSEQLRDTSQILLTAHHQEDQAETVLLQLLRGSGLPGLSAMPVLARLGSGWLMRPYLTITRQQILEYAEHYKLNWINDPSNCDTRVARSFIRQQIIPMLQQYWPSATKMLARSAQHCASAQSLLDHYIRRDYQVIRDPSDNSLSCPALISLTPLHQGAILRYWLRENGFLLPSTAKLTQILKTVICSAYATQPLVVWGNTEVRRYGDRLYVMRSSQPIPSDLQHEIYHWNLAKYGTFKLPHPLGTLSWQGSLAQEWRNRIVRVRLRTEGQHCYLLDKQHKRSLKKLLQQWRIPPWKRNSIPLLYHDKEPILLAVAGYYSAPQLQAKLLGLCCKDERYIR